MIQVERLICGNDFHILLDGVDVARIDIDDDNASENFVRSIESFIEQVYVPGYEVEIKNDDEGFGIIVDVFDEDDIVDTCCIWFEDFQVYED